MNPELAAPESVMHDEATWSEVRASFAGIEHKAYLNAAGMAPIPRGVRDAGHTVLDRHFTNVRGFATSYLEMATAARAQVAAFFGTESSNIAFVGTTSMGMSLLALQLSRTIPLRRHILTSRDEFPSTTLPWQRREFEVERLEPDAGPECSVEHLLAHVRPDTAAVVLSYVQFGTGVRHDVSALALALRERGVPFILNATQAAGVIPIDLRTLPVAALLASGNKWMLSGPGTAVLFLSPELRGEHFPPLAGWLSRVNPLAFDDHHPALTRDAAGLELGLGSLVPLACIRAGASFLAQLGLESVHTRVMQLGDMLMERLSAAGADIITPRERSRRAGIVCARRTDAADWLRRAEEEGVIVVGRGPGVVRISPHIYNTPADIERLMALW